MTAKANFPSFIGELLHSLSLNMGLYCSVDWKRTWDGDGIYETIRYANELYHRPSGGGPGFFGERYDMGRFTPGDDAQDSTPKYAEYPAEYNATSWARLSWEFPPASEERL